MQTWLVMESTAMDLEDGATSLRDSGVDAHRRVEDMGNVQKGLLGAAIGLTSLLMILILVWRWWLKRQPATPTVVT